MGRKSDKLLEETQKAAAKNQITVVEFILWCSVPFWICLFLYKKGEIESLSEAKFAGMVGTAAAVLLNIFLIAKGGTKLVLKRHKKAKDVLDKVGEKAVVAAGGAVAKTAAEIAREGARKAAKNSGGKIKWSVNDPDFLTVKDPATGAENGYRLTPSGEWVNVETGSVLDTDSLGDWLGQRSRDAEWVKKQNEKISKGETAFDDKLNDMRKQAEEKQKKLDEESKHRIDTFNKYHTLDDSAENIKKIIERDQRINEAESRINSRIGNTYAVLENGATWTLKAADYSIDVISEFTTPAGKHVVKNAYVLSRNMASRLSDAYVNGKSLGEAGMHAIGDSVVDITQAEVGGLGYGYQFAANAGGDSYKAAMQAVADGEDPVEAGVVGFFTGGVKTAAGGLIDKGAGALQKSYASQYTSKMIGLNKKLMNGEIKETVYKGSTQVLKRQMDNSVKMIDKVGKTLVTDGTNDIIASVNDKLFNTHRKM